MYAKSGRLCLYVHGLSCYAKPSMISIEPGTTADSFLARARLFGEMYPSLCGRPHPKNNWLLREPSWFARISRVSIARVVLCARSINLAVAHRLNNNNPNLHLNTFVYRWYILYSQNKKREAPYHFRSRSALYNI